MNNPCAQVRCEITASSPAILTAGLVCLRTHRIASAKLAAGGSFDFAAPGQSMGLRKPMGKVTWIMGFLNFFFEKAHAWINAKKREERGNTVAIS